MSYMTKINIPALQSRVVFKWVVRCYGNRRKFKDKIIWNEKKKKYYFKFSRDILCHIDAAPGKNIEKDGNLTWEVFVPDIGVRIKRNRIAPITLQIYFLNHLDIFYCIISTFAELCISLPCLSLTCVFPILRWYVDFSYKRIVALYKEILKDFISIQ